MVSFQNNKNKHAYIECMQNTTTKEDFPKIEIYYNIQWLRPEDQNWLVCHQHPTPGQQGYFFAGSKFPLHLVNLQNCFI